MIQDGQATCDLPALYNLHKQDVNPADVNEDGPDALMLVASVAGMSLLETCPAAGDEMYNGDKPALYRSLRQVQHLPLTD
jgi:hypothetical protein